MENVKNHGAEESVELNPHGAMATFAGLLCVITGTAISAYFVWLVLPIVFPLPVAALLSFGLFYLGFFASVFAGVEVMDAVEASRTVKLAAIKNSVVSGFKVMFWLEE